MGGDVSLVQGYYGTRAILHGPWEPSLLDVFDRNHVLELELNQAKGWPAGDLTFLAQLPNLLSFEIFNFHVRDVSPIHALRNLRRLGITTYCRTEIDFDHFPGLKVCELQWRAKAKSIFKCLSLERLFINRFDQHDLRPLGNLINVTSLAILTSPAKNLDGLDRLVRLRSLRIANFRNISSLKPIASLVNLEELIVTDCKKIESINELGSLRKLRMLQLSNDGNIDSLHVIEELLNLESLIFYETTNIVDGDLAPIRRHASLKKVAFMNRKHYTDRFEDLDLAADRG